MLQSGKGGGADLRAKLGSRYMNFEHMPILQFLEFAEYSISSCRRTQRYSACGSSVDQRGVFPLLFRVSEGLFLLSDSHVPVLLVWRGRISRGILQQLKECTSWRIIKRSSYAKQTCCKTNSRIFRKNLQEEQRGLAFPVRSFLPPKSA